MQKWWKQPGGGGCRSSINDRDLTGESLKWEKYDSHRTCWVLVLNARNLRWLPVRAGGRHQVSQPSWFLSPMSVHSNLVEQIMRNKLCGHKCDWLCVSVYGSASSIASIQRIFVTINLFMMATQPASQEASIPKTFTSLTVANHLSTASDLSSYAYSI